MRLRVLSLSFLLVGFVSTVTGQFTKVPTDAVVLSKAGIAAILFGTAIDIWRLTREYNQEAGS